MASPVGNRSVGVCSTHTAYWSAASGLLIVTSLWAPRRIAPVWVSRIPAGLSDVELVDQTAWRNPVNKRHSVLDHFATSDAVVFDADLEGFAAVVPAGDEPPVGTVASLRRGGGKV